MISTDTTTTATVMVRDRRVGVGFDGADVEGADGAPIGSAGASVRSGSVIGGAYGCAAAPAPGSRTWSRADRTSSVVAVAVPVALVTALVAAVVTALVVS